MVIPYTEFEHFGIIRFSVMLRTNRQTDGPEHPTHATSAWVMTCTNNLKSENMD